MGNVAKPRATPAEYRARLLEILGARGELMRNDLRHAVEWNMTAATFDALVRPLVAAGQVVVDVRPRRLRTACGVTNRPITFYRLAGEDRSPLTCSEGRGNVAGS